ncbi:DUF4175 domain-containing protein [Hankyongella ginsenosidimutans]|nr:DUF4175 domain-containing protein [Hankyongella ginsenosidimutans]
MAEDRAAYNGRYAVYAGLRAAHWRLQYSEDPRGYETAGLLWDIALDLEGGCRASAMSARRWIR